MAWGGMSQESGNSTGCVAVDVFHQMLARQECHQDASFICKTPRNHKRPPACLLVMPCKVATSRSECVSSDAF